MKYKNHAPLNPEALKDIVESGGIQYKQNAISYIFQCPRCAKSNKLYVRKRDGRYVCWVCQDDTKYRGYNVDLPLSELFGGKRRDYAEQLFGADRDFISSHIDLELADHFNEFDDEDAYMGTEPLEARTWDFFEHYPIDHPKAEPGLNYLIGRGLTLEVAKFFDIRYSVRQNRVCFPMVIDGVQYGWQGRYCGEARHIHKADTCLSPGVPGNYLMFGDMVTKFHRAILVEGPMDALKLAYNGGACASLGKGVTENQIRWLAERAQNLYIGLDRDAGVEINKVMAMAQSMGMRTFVIQPPPHRKDFGDCTFEEAGEALSRPVGVSSHHLVMTLGDDLIMPGQ